MAPTATTAKRHEGEMYSVPYKRRAGAAPAAAAAPCAPPANQQQSAQPPPQQDVCTASATPILPLPPLLLSADQQAAPRTSFHSSLAGTVSQHPWLNAQQNMPPQMIGGPIQASAEVAQQGTMWQGAMT